MKNTSPLVFEPASHLALHRLAAALVPHGGLFESPGSPHPACSILIDVGYSYSHVTPVVDGKVVWTGIRR